MSEINQRHDELRENLIAAVRRAKTIELVMELKMLIGEAHVLRAKELRAAGRVKWSGMVIWRPRDVEDEVKDALGDVDGFEGREFEIRTPSR